MVFGVPTEQTRKLKIKGADNELTRQLEILNFRMVSKEFRKAFIKEVAFRMILWEINKSTSTGNSMQNSYPQNGTNRKRKLPINDSQLTEELKGYVDQSKTAVYSALRQDETLFHEVVDDKTEEIRNDFVSGTEKLSPKVQLFRKKLVDEVVDGNMAENVFDKVSGQTFLVTRHATRLEPKSNPKIEDVEVFAKDIADLIDKCTGNTIEITHAFGTEQFRRNIIELAGHAIVKVCWWWKFSGNFIRDSMVLHWQRI
ncbi:uncharacterized protein LOC119654511 [Hermetia illucens]|uniref:uncharacterized protein LOC119654511 n=1 Tax=Hermetia illucens TaxID=343691 RepID=UPI0018CC2A72|nr:uncharacterized protein LOC119654511 [Hermetia illucens]